MITPKTLKIFCSFAKKPFEEFTRNQIKSESKEKSNNALALAINQLKKEEIISEKKVGKSGLLTLNLNTDLSYYYIALANYYNMNDSVKLTIKRIKDEISPITPFYSLVIFGSYALNEQKKSSDLDIAIFIEEEVKKKQIEAAVNSVKLKSLIEIDVQVISKAEFIEMLINDEENLGKQIARKHLAVHNNQLFYGLILEGMKHGFHV